MILYRKVFKREFLQNCCFALSAAALLFVQILAVQTLNADCECPANTRYFDDSCYSLHAPEHGTRYYVALRDCEDQGGSLTSVKSEKVLNFLTSWMTAGNVTQAYIGINVSAYGIKWKIDQTDIVYLPEIYTDLEYSSNKTFGYRLLADGKVTCCANGPQYYICQRMLTANCIDWRAECANLVETNNNYTMRTLIMEEDHDICYLHVSEDGSVYVAWELQLKVYKHDLNNNTWTGRVLLDFDIDRRVKAVVHLYEDDFLISWSLLHTNGDQIHHLTPPSLQPLLIFGTGEGQSCDTVGCTPFELAIVSVIQYTYTNAVGQERINWGFIDLPNFWFTPLTHLNSDTVLVPNEVKLTFSPWGTSQVLAYVNWRDFWAPQSAEVHVIDGITLEKILLAQFGSSVRDGHFEDWNLMPGYNYSNIIASTADSMSGMLFVLVSDTPTVLLKTIHIPSHIVSSVGLCTSSGADQWFDEKSLISVHNSDIYATKGSALYIIGETATAVESSRSNRIHGHYPYHRFDLERGMRFQQYRIMHECSIEACAYICSKEAAVCVGFGFEESGSSCALLTDQYLVMIDNPIKCEDYKGQDFISSYTVTICDGHLQSGIIIRNSDYFVLQTMTQQRERTFQVTYNPLSITYNKAFRSINIPKLVKAKRLRERRQLMVTDAIQELRVMIELAVFTEHLLYNAYCDKYSIMDEKCVDGILELNEYMKVIVKGAELYYDRVRFPDLHCTIKLLAIYHNAHNITADGEKVSLFHDIQLETLDEKGNIQVDAMKALQRFGAYQEEVMEDLGLSGADHTSLITTHTLADEAVDGYSTVGIAYVDGVCHPFYRVSVCHHKTDNYDTIYILAHEIGHILGADHDGKYEECPNSDNFIMATHNTRENMHNIFFFSCCSLTQIFRNLQSSINCLAWEDGSSSGDDDIFSMPGTEQSREEQCKTEFKGYYVPCYDMLNPPGADGNDIKSSFKAFMEALVPDIKDAECMSHWCMSVNDGQCKESRYQPVLAGTWCDVDKWCIEGRCIDYGIITPKQDARPVCNVRTQTLTAATAMEQAPKDDDDSDPGEFDVDNLIPEDWKDNWKQYLTRYGVLVLGPLFLIVSLTGICGSRRRNNRRANARRVNHNRNNSVLCQVPQQYHKVIVESHMSQQEYDTKVFNDRIKNLMS